MKRIIKDITKLKTICQPLEFLTETGIDKQEGTEIITELKTVLNKHEEILALSAPQIGIAKRIICIRFNDTIKTFINPVINKKIDNIIRIETNASMPNQEIAICRPKEIDIVYYTDEFKYEDNKLIGSAASIFMQQYELLDGIIPGQALALIEEGYKPTVDDIPTIIACENSGGGVIAQIESEEDHFTAEDIKVLAPILSKQQNIFKAIGTNLMNSQDETLKQAYKTLKYYDKVALGEIVPVENPQKMNREQRRAIKFNKNNMFKKGHN